eukprot:TRINITY_DN3830_c0_g1_i6.p2 TRINITY_DN3830_c0_g1~~TRINITY_DN3830_c0_g1_i6.p2  ORF type:complete len:241 (-),score=50.20 TRINITY_DN3830_c0_g1_i6:1234-1908(-)
MVKVFVKHLYQGKEAKYEFELSKTCKIQDLQSNLKASLKKNGVKLKGKELKLVHGGCKLDPASFIWPNVKDASVIQLFLSNKAQKIEIKEKTLKSESPNKQQIEEDNKIESQHIKSAYRAKYIGKGIWQCNYKKKDADFKPYMSNIPSYVVTERWSRIWKITFTTDEKAVEMKVTLRFKLPLSFKTNNNTYRLLQFLGQEGTTHFKVLEPKAEVIKNKKATFHH